MRELCVLRAYVCGIERGSEKDVGMRRNIQKKDRETAASRPIRK